MDEITSFSGDHAFLSNFHPATVRYSGRSYRTVEHAYQAAKTLDGAKRTEIQRSPTPGKAKRRGQNVVIRANWESIKLIVMAKLLRRKFKNPRLRELLLATGDANLVEGNYWGDTFWGVCKGVGTNHLGRLLMEVRDSLRKRQ